MCWLQNTCLALSIWLWASKESLQEGENYEVKQKHPYQWVCLLWETETLSLMLSIENRFFFYMSISLFRQTKTRMMLDKSSYKAEKFLRQMTFCWYLCFSLYVKYWWRYVVANLIRLLLTTVEPACLCNYKRVCHWNRITFNITYRSQKRTPIVELPPGACRDGSWKNDLGQVENIFPQVCKRLFGAANWDNWKFHHNDAV